MSMREKIARAVEAADCHSVGFVDRATDAVLAIIKEHGEEAVEGVATSLHAKDRQRGSSGCGTWAKLCREYPAEAEMYREDARAAINAFLSEARKP